MWHCGKEAFSMTKVPRVRCPRRKKTKGGEGRRVEVSGGITFGHTDLGGRVRESGPGGRWATGCPGEVRG